MRKVLTQNMGTPQRNDLGSRLGRLEAAVSALQKQSTLSSASIGEGGLTIRRGGSIRGEGGGLLDWSGAARFGRQVIGDEAGGYVLLDPEAIGDEWVGLMLHAQDEGWFRRGSIKVNRNQWGNYAPGSLMITSGTDAPTSFQDQSEIRLSSSVGAEIISWDDDGTRTGKLHIAPELDGTSGLTGRGTVVIGSGAGTEPATDMRHHLAINAGDNTRLQSANRLTLRGRGTWATGDGPAYVDLVLDYSNGNYMQCEAVYTRTGGSSGNVYVNSNGTLTRVSSATRYKVNVSDAEFGDEVLDLEPVTWFDRRAAEALADELDSGEPIEGDTVRPIPGLLAEDVEETLGQEFVEYGPDGELEGVLYDRAWIPLLGVVRDLRGRVDALEEQNRALEARLESLEQERNERMSHG